MVKRSLIARLSVRAATIADLEPMMAIGHEGLRPHIETVRVWDQAAEEAGFREHFTPETIQVVRYDGVDIGYFKLIDYPAYLYLDGIYLHQRYRSLGIGTALIRELILPAAKRPVRLRVYRKNPARALYQRLGFAEIEGDADAVVMEHGAASG